MIYAANSFRTEVSGLMNLKGLYLAKVLRYNSLFLMTWKSFVVQINHLDSFQIQNRNML